mmetsp:Transcript_6086/g.25669  ORF Transcript_6086/g.25669 Transcript_6086/m.25669 type:complete len:199 (+) Transcript_6086:576-1172(+)
MSRLLFQDANRGPASVPRACIWGTYLLAVVRVFVAPVSQKSPLGPQKVLFLRGSASIRTDFFVRRGARNRFIFHMKTTGFVMNIIHFLIHGHHHITPMDANRAVFPPVPALIVGGPIWALMHKTLGVRIAYPILLGFVIGYLVYDMTHYYIHFGDCDNSFLKNQKSRHIHHHYLQPNINFGISNPLFDVVFRTLARKE